jgi:phospholipid transport system transporter-binding protein
MDLRIERIDAQHVRVAGRLGFSEAAAALARGGELHAEGAGEINVDVGGLERVDSATLAVLLAWSARARAAGTVLHFSHMPAQLDALAQVCGTGPMLG